MKLEKILEKGLSEHLAHAAVHSTDDGIACPGCSKRFAKLSSVICHLESQFCDLQNLIPSIRECMMHYMGSKGGTPLEMESTFKENMKRYTVYVFQIIPLKWLSQKFFQEKKNQFVCPFRACPFKSTTKEELVMHLKGMVHESTRFGCLQCKRQFGLLSGLITHFEYGCEKRNHRKSI